MGTKANDNNPLLFIIDHVCIDVDTSKYTTTDQAARHSTYPLRALVESVV